MDKEYVALSFWYNKPLNVSEEGLQISLFKFE